MRPPSSAGIERIFQVEDMFDCAGLLARHQTPKGDRLAIVTNAGGPGVMTTDHLLSCNGNLAKLSQETIDKLNQYLPAFWSHGNPVDILGDAQPDRYAGAVEIVLQDPGVDAVLVILTPQSMTDSTGAARALVQGVGKSLKPVLAAWMGAKLVAEGTRILDQAGIPTYDTPEKAVRAFMHLVSYARNLETLHETPREIPMSFDLDRQRVREQFNAVLNEENDILSEEVSKTLLDAYGIPVTRPLAAASPEEAVSWAKQMGYPVVMKIDSPQITHKTEVGGVVLNLASDRAIAVAFKEMTERAKAKRPDATILGVTVQKMVAIPNAFEMIVGMKKDPVFGAVILVGMGGTATEVFQDRALALPPLNETLARRALESLKSWTLLRGYRGKPAVNIDRLIEVLMRFSYLIADYPEIKEMDVNPLLVTPNEVIALDARVVIDRDPAVHCGPQVRPLGDPALPGGIRRPAEAQGRLGHRLEADQAGRRADVARTLGGLLEGVDPFPLQFAHQAVHPRDGHPLLLHRLRPRDRHRGRDRGKRASQAGRRGAIGGRRQP